MEFTVGVDIGGTFTDTVVGDGKGEVRLFKSNTTPLEFRRGIFDCLELAAGYYKLSLEDFLSKVKSLVHGTTIATNAVLTGKVAKTGLLVTKGFRDILLYRHGGRAGEMMFSHRAYPEPYIPRYLTKGVGGRINSEAGEETPLNEEDVGAAIRDFKKWGVEAIAVSLLWSIVNDTHERRVAEIIAQEWPEALVTISSEVNPILREYFRTSSTAMDASLKPFFSKYVEDLRDELVQRGYKGRLLMVNSNGGVMTAEEMIKLPIYAVKSGPSMGPVAGLYFARERGSNNVIVADMGGTSFDVSLVEKGVILSSLFSQVLDTHYSTPCVDVISIGAGGGSIAWLDPGKLTHVGPSSAGALPGPACYMRGGQEPTVTDSNVILGYLNPDYFLGGRMKIDPTLAEKVIKEKIAEPLSLSTVEAASVIHAVVNQNMVSAMEDISVKRGIDPREYSVVAGGGACGIHIARIARELRLKEVIVPKLASGLCAFGMLVCDLKIERARSLQTKTDNFDYEGVNATLRALAEEAEDFLARVGVPRDNREIKFSVAARYPFQVWEINVPLPAKRITPEELPILVERFHQLHESKYAFREKQPVECVHWVVTATGYMPKYEPPMMGLGKDASTIALKGERDVYWVETRSFVKTPLYDGSIMTPGSKVSGPAVIEEPETTVVIPPDFMLEVTPTNNYSLRPK